MAAELGSELGEMLAGLGLNETEVRVLTFLLLQGASLRATEIARRTRLNRTTLYGVLESLSERGLIAVSEVRGVQVFESLPPHRLVDYIERSEEKLANDARRVTELLPEIDRARTGVGGYRPQIKFYEGANGIKQVYEGLMSDNKEKRVHGFTGAQAAFNLMSSDWIEYVWKKRPRMGVYWDAVAVDNSETRHMSRKDKEQLRTTRFLPKEYNFDVELASYDDKTLIISFAKDNPLAIQITDKAIADTVKAIFRYVKNSLEERD